LALRLQSNVGQNLNFAIPAAAAQSAFAGLDPKKIISLAAGVSDSKPGESLDPDLNGAKKLWLSDPTAALRLLREYLTKHPENAEAWALRAQCCDFTNLLHDAVDSAQKAVDLEPENIHYLRSLILCQSQAYQGSTDMADLTRLRQTAEHDLAMGDDYDLAWTSLISVSKAFGDTKSRSTSGRF
jgi:hypothetical protein